MLGGKQSGSTLALYLKLFSSMHITNSSDLFIFRIFRQESSDPMTDKMSDCICSINNSW
uniref:Uncharacterized protein n=1 Tax=Arundo donax TaxID=35708 RepID=A0A0A9B9K6_ARUDO